MPKLLDHFYSMDNLFSHLFDVFKCEKNGKSWAELVYFKSSFSFYRQKIQSQTVSREKMRKKFCIKKAPPHKMLVKLTSVVNILQTALEPIFF